MAIRAYRCGTSAAVFNGAANGPARRDDVEAVRRVGALNFAAARPAAAGFRVIGVAAGRGEVLVCLADGRPEAEARMRAEAGRFIVVRVERWEGGLAAGRWRTVAFRSRRERRGGRRAAGR